MPGTETENLAADGDHMNMDTKPVEGEQRGIAAPEQQVSNVQWASGQGPIQGQSFTGNFGFDGTSNGFPSMGTYPQGDFNQLMQFMPNGMSSNGLVGFPNMMGKLPLSIPSCRLKQISDSRFD